jgi:hypothetical protein
MADTLTISLSIPAGAIATADPEIAAALHALAVLAERRQSSPTLLDAAEVAARFGVSRSWVYENARRLGAVRLGDGPKPRLRFDPERVKAALAAEPEPPARADVPANRPSRRRREPANGVELLPVRGRGRVE